MKLEIICHNEIVGVHCWATQPANAPHSYLRNPHRHTFTIETRFAATGDDREIEIFEQEGKLAAWLEGRFRRRPDGIFELGAQSCEMIAREIMLTFGAQSCEVREDGKGGARYAR